MHFVDPESAPFVQGGLKIAELVKEATDGRIEIEVLAGGSLGGERDTIELAMDNSLDIATCANSVLTNFIPEMGILDQAYLWKNADEAHAAVDGALGDLIKEAAEKIGLHVIGFEESRSATPSPPSPSSPSRTSRVLPSAPWRTSTTRPLSSPSVQCPSP